MTPDEITMLQNFAVMPFLPVAISADGKPVFLDENSNIIASDVLTSLKLKRLITIDRDMPIVGYDYSIYSGCNHFGSMALTAQGQSALDTLDILGADE
jgi:hypothetical protein